MTMLRSQMLGLGLFLTITLTFIIVTAEMGEHEDGGRSAQDNSYMESTDYVGSQSCAGSSCHDEQYATWSDTLHTQKVRPISEPIVLADFTQSVELDHDISIFHLEGTDEYFVNLSGNNHTVDWVLGSGTWKQMFMVDIENGTYILPLQWNTATQEWVGYNLEEWYDDVDVPSVHDWGFGQEPLKQVAKANSWQKNCAGCHLTGYEPQQNVNGEWLSIVGVNVVEYNVGCEACHGPGGAHVDGSGDPDLIWSSGDSQICAQCHVRGVSNNGQHPFPVGMLPGDEVDDHYQQATDVYWLDGNTSREHYQQFREWSDSGHANPTPEVARKTQCMVCHTPEGAVAKFAGETLTAIPDGVTWQVTCQACHDSHGSEYVHDLRAAEEDICIECHNAQDTKALASAHPTMYEMLTGQGGDGIIGNLRMGGAVTCTDCHMPKVVKSAVEWDISSHTFEMLEPSKSIEFGMPNSCTTSCHNGIGSGSILTVESADRVVTSWHREIDAMLIYVPENLTLAQVSIEEAQARKVNAALIATAQDIYGTANFNYELVVHEGSRGVHNFEYARALLYDSFLKSQQIIEMLENAENQAPVAVAGETLVTEIDEYVHFDARASWDPEDSELTYLWDFGDLTSSTKKVVNRTFAKEGTYTVTLTVTDDNQLSDTDTILVHVLDLKGIDHLEQVTDQLDETLDQKANKNDLDAKAGTNLLLGLVTLLIVVWCTIYYMNRHDMAKLKDRVRRLRKRIRHE